MHLMRPFRDAWSRVPTKDGKTLEDSSWQKFTLGLNDVTELYAQLNKKDDKVGPSAEMERDAENEREHELERASEIPDSEPLIQEGKDHEMKSQDDEEEEEEEVVLSSQENVFLSPEDDIVLAPTQTMTELLPESRDVQLEGREFVEEVDIGNVVEIEDVEIEDDSVEDEMVVDENVEEIEDEEVVKAEHENVEENPDTS
ncbi:ring-infected erythrocyte surface antigen-like [Cyprinus carpio]|uniref:Ring-infected erythrocyte surface antigen-like n=1 Tax=Cyprinus carpio TaxID=7962 RepID=A0A9Q9Z9L7_CYPCA|nr:ring-infected erythrocyte surface antigen-like [Cyprinus carpio]